MTATATTDYAPNYDLTAPQMFYPTTGTRTAELDRVRKTLTVFDGGTILVVITVEDEVTPGQVWDMIATAEAPTADEVNGYAVETVDVTELVKGDRIVHTSRSGRETFSTVTDTVFRTYRSIYNEVTHWGHYVVEVDSSYTRVDPGTTYRRALDPQAIRRDERAEHRALMAEFNAMGRRKAPRRG